MRGSTANDASLLLGFRAACARAPFRGAPGRASHPKQNSIRVRALCDVYAKISRRRATLHAHAAHTRIYIYIYTHTSVCHNCMHVMREATPQRSSQGAAAHGGHLGWKDNSGQGSTAAPRASGQGTRGTRRPEHTYTQTHTNACTRTCTFAHANSGIRGHP